MRLAGLAALALAIACSACSPPVAKQYQKDGVQFSYYSNWKIAKDAPIEGKANIRVINIEGPDHAVVILICEPALSAQSLEQFAEAVAQRRGAAIEAKLSVGGVKVAEVNQGTSAPTTLRVAGQNREGILQEFSIELLGQQVPHKARFYVVQGVKYKIMVMSQVSNDKEDRTRAGSELVLNTLAIEGAP